MLYREVQKTDPVKADTSTPVSVTIAGTTSVQLIAANATRKRAWVRNNTAGTVYIAEADTATQATGEEVPAGATWYMGSPPWTGAVAVISPSGSAGTVAGMDFS